MTRRFEITLLNYKDANAPSNVAAPNRPKLRDSPDEPEVLVSLEALSVFVAGSDLSVSDLVDAALVSVGPIPVVVVVAMHPS